MISGPGGPAGMFSMGKSEKAEGPRRSRFYLLEVFNRISSHIQVGFWFVIPAVLAFYSWKLALGLVGIAAVSYYVGSLISDFDIWFNHERGEEETRPQVYEKPFDVEPVTDMQYAILRLIELSNKYYFTIPEMFVWLEQDVPPPKISNLDWIEIVGLLNTLCIQVGNHFEESEQKGPES